MITKLRAFLAGEAGAGIVLLLAAILAIVLDNSPLSWLYDGLLAVPASVQIGALKLAKPLLLWINDGLMAVFFLMVGLEIKREMLEGELSSLAKALMPAVAALGGMMAPALIYILVNFSDPAALRGWAIPAATDIAFAIGVLALLGPRVPAALRVFLLALAILDDLGAIIVIALFYTSNLSGIALALAAVCIAALAAMNWWGVTRITPYVLVGAALWVFVLKSGVHATLAGVVTALAIPLTGPNASDEAANARPLDHLVHALHPWVTWAILPLFAFANAGVSLAGLSLSSLLAPIPLGILLGLFLGKQAGILAAVWATCRLTGAALPGGSSWRQMHGVALLGGIGFTMSLFIGALAFEGPTEAAEVRIGVLAGSLLSALAGYLVLRLATTPRGELPPPATKAGSAAI